MKPLATLRKAYQKGSRHLRLLFREPETFARNVKQYTNPAAFLSGLLDTPELRPIRAERREDRPAPVLHVLLPLIAPAGMTGGPNTVLLIGARLAHRGVPVRFVSCDAPVGPDTRWFWTHLGQLTGLPGRPRDAEVQDACTSALLVGPDDLFLASFWTTAYQAEAALELTRRRRFLYLIQDFEPGFYAWSSRYALALATLDLAFHAVINEATLADFLFEAKAGRFADPAFRANCTVFEPAIDRTRFQPAGTAAARRRRLLVYARPTNPRNLLGLAVSALKIAVASPAFAGDWEIVAIGARGSLPPISLGHGRILQEAPWSDLDGYAGLLRSSDIILTPMLSPHTGYPVLEMVACGGIAVTNRFATKTSARLSALSDNIIAVDATTDGFALGLVTAALRIAAGFDRHAPLDLPASWDESLGAVDAAILDELASPVSSEPYRGSNLRA